MGILGQSLYFMKYSIVTLFLVCLTPSGKLSAAEIEGPLKPHLDKPHLDIQQVFKGERFGNIVVSIKGTIIATWGTSHVRACRSEDGGKTWEQVLPTMFVFEDLSNPT